MTNPGLVKKWIQKAIVQKTISYLPFSHRLNYFFQKYVTHGINLTDEYLTDRIGHARDHLNAYRKLSGLRVPECCMELGTGWYPVVPVCFFLAGSERILSVDITGHITKDRLRITLGRLANWHRSGQAGDETGYLPEKWAILDSLLDHFDHLSLQEIQERLNLTCLVEDARKLPLPDHSIALVHSNNTLEHVYPEILIPILKEFRRILKPEEGVMSHFIDLSDHFAHFDKKISIYNFLRYSDKQWKWIDNSIQPQNRLRIIDYLRIFADLGLPAEIESCRPGNVAELRSMKLDSRFTGHPVEEIAISHCHLVSRCQ